MCMIRTNLKWVYLCINTFRICYLVLLIHSFQNPGSKRSDIHDYHTRNRSNFNQTRNKKKFADKTIRTTGPTTWNLIDDKIKKAISANHFRKSFKSLLIDTYE